jgi:hypothetical protein
MNPQATTRLHQTLSKHDFFKPKERSDHLTKAVQLIRDEFRDSNIVPTVDDGKAIADRIAAAVGKEVPPFESDDFKNAVKEACNEHITILRKPRRENMWP